VVTYGIRDPPRVEAAPGGQMLVRCAGRAEEHDLVVLMAPVVPSDDAATLGARLGIGVDGQGFFEERHDRVDTARSRVRGIYLAGSCRAPVDVARATTDGAAAAGLALSALVPGRKLEVSPVHALVEESRCSGCRTCVGVCPYGAVSCDRGRASVDAALCEGCGTCVAACPSGAMQGRHFTDAQLFAEIEGVLR
jgi:heterodisulfide reductase subunit A